VSIPLGQLRRALRSQVGRAVGAGVGALPAGAWACPTCVARAPAKAWPSALLLGAMLLAPFLLVGVGAWVAWRTARGEAVRKP
jgi:hypothetical protein